MNFEYIFFVANISMYQFFDVPLHIKYNRINILWEVFSERYL